MVPASFPFPGTFQYFLARFSLLLFFIT
jgi:hypothetical protein